YADKGHLPKSIDDLVTEKYLRDRPMDPVTESTDWNEIQGDDPAAKEGETGLKDVKSTAEGTDSNGKEYSKY
ncbi:MAG: hypothetical protein DCC44_12485, partial [Acidobacteria bacterium]